MHSCLIAAALLLQSISVIPQPSVVEEGSKTLTVKVLNPVVRTCAAMRPEGYTIDIDEAGYNYAKHVFNR
ncbi:MAG: hypothetical protein J6O01_05935 [Bacteroidales bacterium]|nr:hypothetical protein [Bacteroidales bacterium]